MWCLGRLLPLMIGERIPEDSDHWLNFLRLSTIMDYLLAPVLSPECIEYIKVLIQEHHDMWKELYPNCGITPRMHYLIHYPECIQKYVNCYTQLYVYIHVYPRANLQQSTFAKFALAYLSTCVSDTVGWFCTGHYCWLSRYQLQALRCIVSVAGTVCQSSECIHGAEESQSARNSCLSFFWFPVGMLMFTWTT